MAPTTNGAAIAPTLVAALKIPVAKALKMQKRFAHLKPEHIKQIQKIVNEEWKYLNKGDIWNSEEY